PQRIAVHARAERPVIKIAPEQAELPQLIRDVFADVGDSAVRSHDHLLALLIFFRIANPALRLVRFQVAQGARSLSSLDLARADPELVEGSRGGFRIPARFGVVFLDAHDPAAGEFSFRLQKDGAVLLQDLKRARPELQAQNVSL